MEKKQMLSRKEYFEMQKNKVKNEFRDILDKVDEIYIDTCALMSPYIPKFLNIIIPCLKEKGKKITILKPILDELNANLNPNRKDVETQMYAYMGKYAIRMLMEASNNVLVSDAVVDYSSFESIRPDGGKNHADPTFIDLVNFRCTAYRLLIITEDTNLAQDLEQAANSASTRKLPLLIYGFRPDGGFVSKKSDAQPVQPHRAHVEEHRSLAQEQIRKVQPQPQQGDSTKFSKDNAGKHIQNGELHIPSTYTKIASVKRPDIIAAYVPESVTEISAQAFSGCVGMRTVVLTDEITVIESSAFANCPSLTSITLPKKITELTASMFKGCKKLAKVQLHDGLTSIAKSAFEGCTALKELEIPVSVMKIDNSAFRDCNLTIKCKEDSCAHRFAVNNGIPFILV